MNVLNQEEIESVRYSHIPNSEWACTIGAYGRKFIELGETKEEAYAKAFLLAEFSLFPPQEDTVVY